MTIRLHFVEQRKQVFAFGHEVHVGKIIDNRIRLSIVKQGVDEVFVTDNTDDVVLVFMEHRKTRITRSAHTVDGLLHRFRIFDHDHIDTGGHDLACRRIAQVKNFVNHALLIIVQFFVVGDNVADLFFRNILSVVSTFDPHDACQQVGRSGCESNNGAEYLLKNRERSGNSFRNRLGGRKRDALGNKLSYHDAEVRHDQSDQHGRKTGRHERQPFHAKRREPLRQRLREVRCGGRGGKKPNECNSNLDSGEKAVGVGRKVKCSRGLFRALLRLLLKNDLAGIDERHLRGGEIPVDKNEDKRDQNAYSNVHEEASHLIKSPPTRRKAKLRSCAARAV